MRAQTNQRIGGGIFTVVIPALLAPMIPTIPLEIGVPLVIVSALIGLALLAHAQFAPNRRMTMAPLVAMSIGLFVFVGGAIWNAWPDEKYSQHEEPAELHDLFISDFQAQSASGIGVKLSGHSLIPLTNNKDLKIEWHVLTDFGGRSRFLAYYLPESPAPVFDVTKFVAENYKGQLDAFPVEKRTAEAPSAETSLTLPFTGKIFIYHEQDLTEGQRSELLGLFRQHGAVPEFRSRSYPLRVFDALQLRKVQRTAKELD